MEQIQAEIDKHFKLTARKQLYFALSVMVVQAIENYEMVSCAGQALVQAKNDEEGGGIPESLYAETARQKANAIRPLFCVARALKNYRQAMGEYPEFASFLTIDKPQGTLDKLLSEIESMTEMSELAYQKDNPGKLLPLREMAFGTDFLRACEKVKIKGEV